MSKPFGLSFAEVDDLDDRGTSPDYGGWRGQRHEQPLIDDESEHGRSGRARAKKSKAAKPR
jgi:hypothetical protein